jgi:ribonuclease-3
MANSTLKQCQDTIEYRFDDEELLAIALRHSSACEQRVDSNERLEFLGDAVLDIIICEELFQQFPHYLEGDLTILKSAVVSGKSCAQVARRLELQPFLQVGKGIDEQRGLPDSLVAAMLESIIGAIYLDGGLKKTRKFVLRHFELLIKLASEDQYHRDYKSMLQQHAQAKLGVTLNYELLDEKGPSHAKAFEIGVSMVIEGKTRRFTPAWGISKKEAEQEAARKSLEELGMLEKGL